ncbi:MAG: hypothetical protein A4E72_02213 [Syntrophus sp. PtaU1.Bin208]|nr:MAG: hypothetical protein A4E72_02213 [Syntrophus sp. PtaU1.Bin208]
MALINCPECNSKISDLALSCPNCGCPQSSWKKQSQKQNFLTRFLLWFFPIIDDDYTRNSIINILEKVSFAPSLKTINGCGRSIYGQLLFSDSENIYIKATFFTIFFIPIIPTGAYLVKEEDYGSYVFLGKLPICKLLSILSFSQIIKFIISVIFTSASMFVVFFLGMGLLVYLYRLFKAL